VQEASVFITASNQEFSGILVKEKDKFYVLTVAHGLLLNGNAAKGSDNKAKVARDVKLMLHGDRGRLLHWDYCLHTATAYVTEHLKTRSEGYNDYHKMAVDRAVFVLSSVDDSDYLEDDSCAILHNVKNSFKVRGAGFKRNDDGSVGPSSFHDAILDVTERKHGVGKINNCYTLPSTSGTGFCDKKYRVAGVAHGNFIVPVNSDSRVPVASVVLVDRHVELINDNKKAERFDPLSKPAPLEIGGRRPPAPVLVQVSTKRQKKTEGKKFAGQS